MLLKMIKAFFNACKSTPHKVAGNSLLRLVNYSSIHQHPTTKLILKFGIVALAYYGAAMLGLMVPYKESVITLLWLPTGIAVGAIMRWGKVSILAILTAAYFAEHSLGLSVNTALIIALGNTLAPITTAYCLQHFSVYNALFDSQLAKRADILLMIAFAMIGMTISAFIGVGALYASGTISANEVSKLWLIWWMGDSMGVLLALPLLLNIRRIKIGISINQLIKVTLWLLFFILGELVILNSVEGINKQFMLSVFLTLPILIWVAMYFGVVGGSIAVILLSVVVVWATSIGYGDLYSTDIDESVFSLWLFISSLTIVMLLISSLQAERNAATALLRDSERKFKAMIDGALDGIVTIDALGNIVEFNPAAERIFGYKRAAVIGQALTEMIVPKNQRKAHATKHREYILSGKKHLFDQRLELTAMRADGSEFPVELTITALKGENGNPNSLVTGFIRDISVQKIAQQEVEKMLFYDMLTGLANRRLLIEHFQHALLNMGRTGNHCALMFIDLDHFKLLNDTKGHDIGDLLLKELARRLQHTLRASDTLARLSGDEFVVVLENLDASVTEAKDQVIEVAQKILNVFILPFNLNGFSFNTTGSVGITLIENNTMGFEDHLRHADTAMYLAKTRGRNTYCFYDASTQDFIDRQLAIESALKDALRKSEFTLYYQSIVNRNREVVAAETLLRWESSILGAVGPAEFIPVAEKSGQIIAIGDWVLKNACAQLKTWQRIPECQHLVLSVNISAKQLIRDDFIAHLKRYIDNTQINPNLLKLELTETAAIDHIEEAVIKFKQIQAMGVRIALDDFGAGQSSLIHIKKLPVSQLKIDLSFVADMLTDSNDAAIIQMILAIGKTIGCQVVAEGVETELQFEALKHDGCELFQGYYFSIPLPLNGFEANLRNS